MKKASNVVTVTAFRVQSAMRTSGMHVTWLNLVLLSVLVHHVVTDLSQEVEGGRSSAVTHQGE